MSAAHFKILVVYGVFLFFSLCFFKSYTFVLSGDFAIFSIIHFLADF